MKTIYFIFSATLLFSVISLNPPAYGMEQIIRPHMSVRSQGMGGVKLNTGYYEENFFGNPARVTANPKFRLDLFDFSVETNSNMISALPDLTGGDKDQLMTKMSNRVGENAHARLQFSNPPFLPSFYIASNETRRWALGVSLSMISIQADVDFRRSFRVNPGVVVDVGPAVTYGRKFLDNDALSVGLTAHFLTRVSSNQDISFADLLHNASLSINDVGSQGSMINFDLGGTYRLPWTWKDFSFDTALSLNNLLGGTFHDFIKVIENSAPPIAQPFSLGLGVAAKKKDLWKFTDFMLALEFFDIGNNTDGNLFRCLHFGAEAKYGVLIPRLGFNQIFLSAGLGLDLKYFSLDLSTYGEEMTLNPGGSQDRRYALKMAFKI